MRKAKSGFERVPLEVVRRVLEEQNNAEDESHNLTEADKHFKPVAHNQSPRANNVQKRRARPKRSIHTEGEDHPLGLWIDKEIFRKHQNRPPQIALHDPMLNPNNRYLALADCVLQDKKPSPKKQVSETASRGRA